MKIVEEIVSPRLLRPHANDGLLPGRHDFLDIQIAALEFRRYRIKIGNVDFERASGRRTELGGFEFAVLDGQRQRNGILRRRPARNQRDRQRQQNSEDLPPI
jgi:hypothetical protein